jgi:hypothetical protein
MPFKNSKFSLDKLKFIGDFISAKHIYMPFISKISFQKNYTQKCSKNKNNNISTFNDKLLFFNQITEPCDTIVEKNPIIYCQNSVGNWLQDYIIKL